jgi:hypothetical protein
LLIERSGSGSITLTNGSGIGSGRPKNMWIRWIRIRIRNTESLGSIRIFSGHQWCGSVTFWYGSITADPCLCCKDLDSDPAIFVSYLQDGSWKLLFFRSFFAYYFLKLHLHKFSKIKVIKKSQNSRNHGFSYHLCTMTEGSGAVPRTNGSGSGSGRPRNIQIRNTDLNTTILLQDCSVACCRTIGVSNTGVGSAN